MADEIRLVPYDPVWPDLFAAERDRVAAAFVAPPLSIEHMGSTAVAGLSAKPVIDIIVLVTDLRLGHAAVPNLEALGYSYWRDNPDKTKLFLVKGLTTGRTHHLHIHADAAEVERHLLFRDHLRKNPGDRDSYAALKRDLAERYRNDREAYTNAKSIFVDAIVAKAVGSERSLI